MDGREFLRSALDLLRSRASGIGALQRSLTDRVLRLRETNWAKQRRILRGGLLCKPPPQESQHIFVRRRFIFTPHPDLKSVGQALDDLSTLRNQADYQLATSGKFSSAKSATNGVTAATAMVALLDTLDADPARRAAVVAALQAAWP